MLKRFGLIGDIHAEDAFLASAIDRITLEGIDRILAVGDVVDGCGDVDRCVELLERHHVDCVRGNHDAWLVNDQMRDSPVATVLDDLAPSTQWYLAHLPATRRFDTRGGPLLLCHGLGSDNMIFVDPEGVELRQHVEYEGKKLRARSQLGIDPDIRILVNGHTHQRMAKQFGRLTIINAGTLCARDAPCFAVVDLAVKTVQWFDLDEEGRVLEGGLESMDWLT